VWEGVKRLSAVRIPNLTATSAQLAREWDSTRSVRMRNDRETHAVKSALPDAAREPS
jgi:hypothetical protein